MRTVVETVPDEPEAPEPQVPEPAPEPEAPEPEVPEPTEPPADHLEPLVDVLTVARMLHVSERKVRYLAEAGTLPHYRLGGRLLRFRASEVYAWLASRREGTAS